VNDLIQNWIIKADHDYKIALSEIKTEDPAFDMICYHMQQCTEKYLKAWLLSQNVPVKKTHNISILLEQCILIDNSFSSLLESGVESLTVYATDTRYPDDFYMPTKEETDNAVLLVDGVKKFITSKLSAGR
jgi:HEPN domain-containing protein